MLERGWSVDTQIESDNHLGIEALGRLKDYREHQLFIKKGNKMNTEFNTQERNPSNGVTPNTSATTEFVTQGDKPVVVQHPNDVDADLDVTPVTETVTLQ